MKKIILIIIVSIYSNLYSQLTGEIKDVYEGSKIRYKKITKDDKTIHIEKWLNQSNITKNQYYHLEKDKKKDHIYHLDTFFFNLSELNNDSIHSLYLIYNNEVMVINVKNNFARVHLNFKELKFKKGVFEIDFKKIVKEKLFKNKKTPKFVLREEIEFDTFPFEEDKK